MGYVNQPQPGRYTTRLLSDPPNRRGLVALIAVWSIVAVLAVAVIVQQRARTTPAPLPAILIVATPTIHPIAGRASPPERSEPPATATAEPAAPAPVVIVQTVEVPVAVYIERSAPAAAPAQEAQPEPTPTYSDFYTNIPTPAPELLAACAKEPARSQSWVCGGGQP